MNGELHAALDRAIPKADFAELIGVGEARVSQMRSEGALDRGASGMQWLLAYSARLRGQAAGREAAGVLSKERTALSRERQQPLYNGVHAHASSVPIPALRAAIVAAVVFLLCQVAT